jgi:hypothetical protein
MEYSGIELEVAMPQQQKLAWFTLGLCVVVLLVYGALAAFIGPKAALAAFALMAAWAFSGLFYRKREGQIVFDERDRAIHANAVKACAGCVYLYFVACCVTMSQLRHTAGTVPVVWLEYMVWFGAVILLGSWALATLLLYHREAA